MHNDIERLHALDAVRAGALLLGIVLHGTMSFMPSLTTLGWPIADHSPSEFLQAAFYIIHIFRMTAFFVVAGFFAHLVFHRRGARGFARDRAKRILVPLVVGWIVITPIVIAIFVWATLNAGRPLTPPPAPDTALAVPLIHLWFLYVLALLYVIVLAARALILKVFDGVALRARADAVVGWLMRSHLAPIVLALPVALCLTAWPGWTVYQGIPTPDQSLIPNLPAFVGYGVAFVFGWLLHRQQTLLSVLQRAWAGYAVGALVASAAIIVLGSMPLPPAVGAVAYAVASWIWTFALIGAAMRFLSAHRPVVRYLADASYWMYLLHLPLIFGLQELMSDWPLHWSIKFPLLMIVTVALLLVSYRYLVRNTIIGETLNGRRFDDRAAVPAPVASAQPTSQAGSLASLSGVKKRYGQTVALDGFDLDIQRGELLAVLGPNGAGKTTAISLLLGLEQPDAGEVSLFGLSPTSLVARRQIGIMMQEVALPPELRVRELLHLTAGYYATPLDPDAAMQMTGTTALAQRPYGKLSGGQKRQVQFAMAICGRPQLLFLDEPTVGLDIKARETMWNTIRELVRGGCSVVLTTHYLEEAEALADRVVVTAKGKVLANASVGDMRALVSRRRIECTTRTPIETIRTWPEIETVTATHGRIVITTKHAEAVVRRLLQADDTVADLEVRRAGLSEAFTELTQEAA
ncbi:MAG TPA: acyltransferase family protein [Povalibacter sp.]|uniref:acyltransferase family protein n=1 Tax=Povalibacter sp. TaxID=1962978 RepID=UPI002B61F834|nr:acyltransferase family protein [Povalibacter sp.]HMN44551.1 acyltransferase family protein [Povalibacter sp.]